MKMKKRQFLNVLTYAGYPKPTMTRSFCFFYHVNNFNGSSKGIKGKDVQGFE